MKQTLHVEAQAFSPAECTDLTALLGRPPTRGHVGVSISGGGSRAACAGVGALRALHAFGLLRHVRALSVVSGGSWAAVPFTFLPDGFDDEHLLGAFVPDPAALHWHAERTPSHLGYLPSGSLMAAFTEGSMQSIVLLIESVRDAIHGLPGDRLWSRQIAEQILQPFGLAAFTEDGRPDDLFAASPAAADALRAAYPNLPRRIYPVRQSEALPRPFLAVQSAMRVKGPDGSVVLAPATFTPVWSGILGHGIGTLDGIEVGGGAISSHAFGGRRVGGTVTRPRVELSAPFALSDVAGICSAAYADGASDRGFDEITPKLTYFQPLAEDSPSATGLFVDAGVMENTGIAGLLAFPEIDAILAIISPPTAVERHGRDLVIDRQIAALFGYREYEKGRGWRRYCEPGIGSADRDGCQVFRSDQGEFQALLAAFGARYDAGEPLVVEAIHEVVQNDRFAVAGGRKVRVVWALQGKVQRFASRLRPSVHLGRGPAFPNIPTASTAMPTPVVSLLAHFSAWMLAETRAVVERLFDPA
ncbi:MAG: hypothetical protein KC620_20980 [Myxococcales bacterium]|nr:hypothetical protein [Myxococcales bacterium]